MTIRIILRKNDLFKAAILIILLIMGISSIVPQTLELYWGKDGSTLPNSNEYATSQWIKENTSSSTIIISDPVSMDIISSLSDRFSLAQFSMGKPVRQPQDFTRVDYVLNLFKADNSIQVYYYLSKIAELGLSGDEFYRSFKSIDDPSFVILLSSRTVEWIKSGGERVVTYLTEKPILEQYKNLFDLAYFDILYSDSNSIYIFKPKYSAILPLNDYLGETGVVSHDQLLLDLPLIDNLRGNAFDKSIYCNDVTIVSQMWSIDDDKELYFDGQKSYVYVNSSQILDLNNEFTISLWVKLERNTQKEQTVLYKPEQFLLRLDAASEGSSLSFYVYDGSSWEPRVKSGIVPQLGDWYNVVAIYKKTSLSLYINGTLARTIQQQRVPISSNETIFIGKPNYFNGYIKNVQVFGFALDSYEIQNIYQNKTDGYSIFFNSHIHETGNLIELPLTFNNQNVDLFLQLEALSNSNSIIQDEPIMNFQLFSGQTLIYERDLSTSNIQNGLISLGTINIIPNATYVAKLDVLSRNYDLKITNLLVNSIGE